MKKDAVIASGTCASLVRLAYRGMPEVAILSPSAFSFQVEVAR